jgi:polyisoprenoid-binding protein YceI
MRLSIVTLGAALLAGAPVHAQERAIDTQRSSITIHVGKAGLLSVAAHDHWVNAPIASGAVDDSGEGRVAFKVRSAALMVRPDPKVDAKTQGQIQKDMEEMTLEPGKYPEIEFRSTHLEKAGESDFRVDGVLTLHGASKPVRVNVKRDGNSYTGHAAIRQTEFGIKPVSLGGGAIRVKDALEIEFRIFTSAAQ